MNALRSLMSDFSLKAFAGGAGAAILFCAVVAISLSVSGAKTKEYLQSLMASKMVVIDKPGFPKADVKEAHIETVPTAAPKPPSTVIEPDLSAADKPAPAANDSQKFPLKGLTEKTPEGLLPIIRKDDGLTPFKAYARPYTKSADIPKVAIVVEGFGLRKDQSEAALALPADVTLLISPYAAQPKTWLEKAHAAGREVWLTVPMEHDALNAADPGPRALSSTALLAENETRLKTVLAKAQGYAGVAGFYSDRFKNVALMMQTLFESVFARGLGYLELNPTPPASIADTAARLKAPYAQTVLHLDDPRFLKNPADALEIIESRALDKKFAVIVMPAYPKLIEAVVKWEASLAGKGIVLAPLSAVAKAE